jgi:thymidylate synthase (FAD)
MEVNLVSKTTPNNNYFVEKLKEIGEDPKEYEDLTSEQLMIYIARVSSSRDNKLEDYEGLLNYLIDEGHWSPFQMADMTVEIETSRAIGRQLIRHRSFKFQEFSQRYSSDIEFEDVELRGQPENNRQSSSERLASIRYAYDEDNDFKYSYPADEAVDFDSSKWKAMLKAKKALNKIDQAYQKLIDTGYASETARMILPECTRTTLYMKGSVRSWIHYLELRSKENTQKEHREVANEIGKIFQQEFPVISNALDFNYE